MVKKDFYIVTQYTYTYRKRKWKFLQSNTLTSWFLLHCIPSHLVPFLFTENKNNWF